MFDEEQIKFLTPEFVFEDNDTPVKDKPESGNIREEISNSEVEME